MQKRGANTRIQISSREKRPSGKSLTITHNKKIANQIEKELLSKIDSILIEYKLNNDLIPTFATKIPQPNLNNNPKTANENKKIEEAKSGPNGPKIGRAPSADPNIKMPKTTKNLDFDQNMPNINISINELKKEKKLPKVKKKKMGKKYKDGFLTGVGLIKTKKKKEEERQNKFMAKNDEEINAMLSNIDEIDNFIKNPEKGKDSDLFEGSPGYRDRMAKNKHDFEELIKEIDGYKKEMQDEFDEIKYLIQFTNNTEKLIERHKTVINGIFKGAGLKKKILDEKKDKDQKVKRHHSQSTKIQKYLEIVQEVDKVDQEYGQDDEDIENYDDEFLATSVSELNGVFYKLKKINKIKDNLNNIQDDCLGYHEKLKDTLKRSESAKPPLRKEEQKI